MSSAFRLFLSVLLLTALVGCGGGAPGAGTPGDENDPAKTTDLQNVD